MWPLEISPHPSLASWVVAMAVGQDQSLHLRPRKRKHSRLPSPLWLERPMVETRLFGSKSYYKRRDKQMLVKIASATGTEVQLGFTYKSTFKFFFLLCWQIDVKWPWQLHCNHVTPRLKYFLVIFNARLREESPDSLTCRSRPSIIRNKLSFSPVFLYCLVTWIFFIDDPTHIHISPFYPFILVVSPS